MDVETAIGTRPREWAHESAMQSVNRELSDSIRHLHSVNAARFEMCAKVIDYQRAMIEELQSRLTT